MVTEYSIEQIKEVQDNLKTIIKRMEAMKRLESNPDYKEVFTEGYFENESRRLVLMLGDPNSQSKDAYIEQMIGIAQFANYTRAIKQLGEQAIRQLEGAIQAENEYYEEMKTGE